MTDRVRFSRTLFGEQQPLVPPVLRHQRQAARGRSGAARGLAVVTGRPQTSIVPLRARTTPNSAWNSSRWPCPCRPATPSTSPSCRSRSTPASRCADREVAHAQRDAPGRGRLALGIEAVEPPSEHLGDDLVVADRAVS